LVAKADVQTPIEGRAALGMASESFVQHRDLRGLRRRDVDRRVHRWSVGDQGDPRAPRGKSVPGARTAAAAGPGAACAIPRLKRFSQRHQFKRIFL